MKVLHLSTKERLGGAAAAAWRLVEAQRALGVESRMLVRTKQESEQVSATDDGKLAAWHEGIATPWLQRRLKAGESWFTVGCLDAFVEGHPWVQEADVLHLHWVAEWLSAEAVARLAHLGKPLLWTFHDLWPVTGGNHYAGSNAAEGEAWQDGSTLPEPLRGIAGREFARKLEQLHALPLHVLSPSRWLADVVRRSRIGSRWDVQVLPNGIGTDRFKPAPQAEARAQWKLPADKVLLLFGCQALGEQRKGFSALRAALHELGSQHGFSRESAELVIFGADRPDFTDLPIMARHVGSVAAESDMAALYQSADAFLCPALEDNLPTTVIESLACGVPVIGFATGGVPDLVTHEQNGLLAPCGDVPALAAQLALFTGEATLRQRLQSNARAADKQTFSVQTQAQQSVEIYRSAIAGLRPATQPSATVSPCSPSFTMIPGEAPWLLEAAAEAVQIAAQREAALRQKNDELRAKLARVKENVAKKNKPVEAKASWFQRLLRKRRP